MTEIQNEKVEKYLNITKEALLKAKSAPENLDLENARKNFIDMIERYVSDAEHFKAKDDLVNAFAAINYAHGWLDAGATIGLWDVSDSKLFSIDEKEV